MISSFKNFSPFLICASPWGVIYEAPLFWSGREAMLAHKERPSRSHSQCLFSPARGLRRALVCLQGVYRAFVVNAKFMSVSSAAHIDFMATCVIEIFGLDSAAAYEHGFTYIKQLAVLLRGALSMKTKDAFREVYCWQTVNTLELWTRLLATHADKEV